jgi:hypothetical protein
MIHLRHGTASKGCQSAKPRTVWFQAAGQSAFGRWYASPASLGQKPCRWVTRCQCSTLRVCLFSQGGDTAAYTQEAFLAAELDAARRLPSRCQRPARPCEGAGHLPAPHSEEYAQFFAIRSRIDGRIRTGRHCKHGCSFRPRTSIFMRQSWSYSCGNRIFPARRVSEAGSYHRTPPPPQTRTPLPHPPSEPEQRQRIPKALGPAIA